MIVSASRRTDIPARYADWLLNRVREGYVLVRNPMNGRQVSRVSLRPDAVEGMVLWTKNPAPLIGRLAELRDFAYYFQFTLNPYGPDVEPNLPDKAECLVPTLLRLSDAIGPERIVWRYDPILLREGASVAYHIDRFGSLARALHGRVRKCTFSFLDEYRCMRRWARRLGIRAPEEEEMRGIGASFARIAAEYGLALDTCAEAIDLSEYGIGHARCIDGAIFEELCGYPLRARKDAGQRPDCGCMASVDIGAYDTCENGCLYCYANRSAAAVRGNAAAHDPLSPLLTGKLHEGDTVCERAMASLRR